ncbi:uncharacterized protein LOC122074834 [Macadamia integrifolia]|uniref:uncharacterized protein LOC122074834 n=1 Tax=Macadamia integrifolia TaxID=60698 RepID=UPI001C4F3D44|nr:uncharacterized protein LOC122074834 [Macadamia integrifolia]
MMQNHSKLLLIKTTQNQINNPLNRNPDKEKGFSVFSIFSSPNLSIITIFSYNPSLISENFYSLSETHYRESKKGRMNSVCISSCVDDARLPVRATYRNLYKWPESDAEFVRSVSSNSNGSSRSSNWGGGHGHPRVVDSISCRQMYLRSYTFSRKETVPEKTVKCFGGVKERVVHKNQKKKKKKRKGGSEKKCAVMRKVKDMSCAALFRIFHNLLSCTTSVDVADH